MNRMTISQICKATESTLFDRKSARIDAKTLAILLIAFANADGGIIAVGVEDDGTITGIDNYKENINELQIAPQLTDIPPQTTPQLGSSINMT